MREIFFLLGGKLSNGEISKGYFDMGETFFCAWDNLEVSVFGAKGHKRSCNPLIGTPGYCGKYCT